jgi:UDP-3-O-[3-hydroxymyristoyl] glucosamine N-acyltransferase
MYRLKRYDVWASEIAGYLNKELEGEDFKITDFHSIKIEPAIKRRNCGDVDRGKKILLIAKSPMPGFSHAGFIQSDTPDLDLAYILREFFASQPINDIHATAVVSKETQIGRNVMIGAHSVIGPDVAVGDNTKILNNVTINGPVTIGKFCVVKDGAVIGSEGWGFIKDEEGIPFHPPQLGNILLGNKVWIGSNSTVERAMIEDTVIGEDVKVDDLVHIGGGSRIGPKCELTAGVVIASNVVIGMNVRIAPNAVIRENLCIENDVLVGQGAVVIKDLPAGHVYVGNPARSIKQKKS